MSEPRTMYAVMSGDYDWWSLDGLFERREDAEAAIALGFGMNVEECMFYPAGTLPTRYPRWVVGGPVYRPDARRPERTPAPVAPRAVASHQWAETGGAPLGAPVVEVSEYSSPPWSGSWWVQVTAESKEAATEVWLETAAKLRAGALGHKGSER